MSVIPISPFPSIHPVALRLADQSIDVPARFALAIRMITPPDINTKMAPNRVPFSLRSHSFLVRSQQSLPRLKALGLFYTSTDYQVPNANNVGMAAVLKRGVLTRTERVAAVG